MVEVFKTNVQNETLANQLMEELSIHFPHCKINFDLYDCDNILRVEGNMVNPERIIETLNKNGYLCHILE